MNNINLPKFSKVKITYAVLLLILLVLLIVYRGYLGAVIRPFAISAAIAYLLNPIVIFFERKGMKRLPSVIIVSLLFLVLILAFCFILIPQLVKDIGILIENLPKYSTEIQGVLKSFQDGYVNSNLPQSIKDVINENILGIQDMLLAALQKVADTIIAAFARVFDLVIIPILAFYLLKDANYFINQGVFLIPKSKRSRAVLLLRDIDNVFGSFIRGQLIVAAFVGVFTTIALLLIKVRYSVILGIFAGISNIIPYFGPIIGIVPTVIFALFDSPTKALYAAIAFIIIQQLESGLLTPKIIGDSVGLHPVYVILALIVGGKLFGIVGLIIAVPVLAALKLTIRHFLSVASQ